MPTFQLAMRASLVPMITLPGVSPSPHGWRRCKQAMGWQLGLVFGIVFDDELPCTGVHSTGANSECEMSKAVNNMINGTGTFSVKVSGKMVTVSQELEGEEMRYEFKVVKSSQNAIGCEFVRGDDGVSKSLSGRNVFSHPDGDKQYALVIKEKDIKFSVNRKLVKTGGESVKGYMTFLGTKK